ELGEIAPIVAGQAFKILLGHLCGGLDLDDVAVRFGVSEYRRGGDACLECLDGFVHVVYVVMTIWSRPLSGVGEGRFCSGAAVLQQDAQGHRLDTGNREKAPHVSYLRNNVVLRFESRSTPCCLGKSQVAGRVSPRVGRAGFLTHPRGFAYFAIPALRTAHDRDPAGIAITGHPRLSPWAGKKTLPPNRASSALCFCLCAA